MSCHKFLNVVRGMEKDESGATAIEYGLIAAFIALIIIGSVILVGDDLSNIFNSVAGAF